MSKVDMRKIDFDETSENPEMDTVRVVGKKENKSNSDMAGGLKKRIAAQRHFSDEKISMKASTERNRYSH